MYSMVFFLELRTFCRSLEQTKYQIHRLLQGKISDRQTQIDVALSQSCIINNHISYGFKRFNCFCRANPLQLKDLTETVKKNLQWLIFRIISISNQDGWVITQKKLFIIQKLRLKRDCSLKSDHRHIFILAYLLPMASDLLIWWLLQYPKVCNFFSHSC